MTVVIYGASGTMGRLAFEYFQSQSFKVIGVDALSKEPNAIKDLNSVRNCDVVIDFSHPNQLNSLLDYAIAQKTPLVIATTGYTPKQEQDIKDASLKVAIFKSANLSLGVHILRNILKDYTKILEQTYDIEIIEKHHRYKVDAPSGTANLLASTIANSSNNPKTIITDRSKTNVKRNSNEIGIQSVRAGSIVGEHTILFASDDDTIELTHKAQSKLMFVKGAVVASSFIVTQENGLYSMDDIPLERIT
jgi:4-hydroxy-tetrahydrodipicolinate reductase